MSFTKTPPILPMEVGLERELMMFLLLEVKQIKGLTTALDQEAGINGKWLKPFEPYNISSQRLLQVIIHMAYYAGRGRLEKISERLLNKLYDDIIPIYEAKMERKRRQRPPCPQYMSLLHREIPQKS